MIIKCPICRNQVSTMAGTCPSCGTEISGQLRKCLNCGNYCLVTQDKCPDCGSQLQPPSIPPVEEEKQEAPSQPPRKKKKRKPRWGCLITIVVLPILCCAGYYYHQYQVKQKEQDDYERLAEVSNPDFFQQFLDEYPNSQYRDEIQERMLVLQEEAKDWEQLLKKINHSNVTKFLQNHPGSLRQRLCEDMLDSIDWQKALATGTEEAFTNYLSQHPSGRYATEAADKKNSILVSKVTPEEKAMIRGTLESFFSKAIGEQDIEAAKAAIPGTMISFCGKQNADAETIIQYAREKMAKDVIGLHYLVGQKMKIYKETLPDGNTGFSVEASVQETISRSDTNQPASNLYSVKAQLNLEQKIVRMNITK